jgi:hypothetical protein
MDPATLIGHRVKAASAFSAHIDGYPEMLLRLEFDDGRCICLLVTSPAPPPRPRPPAAVRGQRGPRRNG